jgi:hypothetical protein
LTTLVTGEENAGAGLDETGLSTGLGARAARDDASLMETGFAFATTFLTGFAFTTFLTAFFGFAANFFEAFVFTAALDFTFDFAFTFDLTAMTHILT